MKGRGDSPKPPPRQIFILTLEEKKTVYFVIIAFVLGLATKYYRDHHPAPLPKPTISVRDKGVRKHSRSSHR